MAEIKRVRKTQIAESADRACRLMTPLIITDLFDNSPISRIQSAADVARHFSDEVVRITPDYNDFLGPPTQRTEYEVTLGKFLEASVKYKDLPMYVSEVETPSTIRAMFDMPRWIQPQFERVVSKIFLSGTATYPICHFDGDYRNLVLYQVFGTKRVFLFPPSVSPSLSPVFNFSGLKLSEFPLEDRIRLTNDLGGFWGELGTGEALCLPPGWWHSVEYVTPTLSVNFRYGRELGHFLLNVLPANYRVPLAAGLMTESERIDWGLQLLRVFFAPYESATKRYDVIQLALRDMLVHLRMQAYAGYMYPGIDLERLAVCRKIELMATKLPFFDYEVRIESQPLRDTKQISGARSQHFASERRNTSATRWSEWMSLLGFPEQPEHLTNFQSVLLQQLLDFGLSVREPTQYETKEYADA